MEIKINIINNGEAIGTIGWLARNASTIKLGVTKSGKQGAWLHDANGKQITVLAIRGYHSGAGDEIVRAENDCGEYYGQLASDVSFTPAAWGIVKDLIDIAVREMDRVEEEIAGRVSVRIA